MEQSKFYQIKNVTEHEYTLVGCDRSVIIRPIQDIDKTASVFTVQDAKDGDILWHSDSASNGIFIFKKIRYDDKVLCYCDYDSEDHFCLSEHHTCCWADAKILHPATKEQRDTLFAKMHEAGYMWDSESKQLLFLKAEPRDTQNPTWSEEDEHNIQNIDSVLFYDKTLPEDTCVKLRDFLKSLKQRIGG